VFRGGVERVDLDGDYLIIGSGIAALRAAASLAGAGDVLILTKGGPREGNTGYAQGGIAAAVGPDDSPASHLRDTLAAGDGLCDERAVAVLVEEGPRYVRELIDWGAQFDRAPDGSPALAIEGAHSVRRVLHARDATGREIGRVLWTRVSPMANVRVIDYARAVSVIVENGRCAGVRFLQENGALAMARARSTLLATGGAGQVYRETTNPSVATGDGVAIAYLAGAAVTDLEFVQFHPTALDVPGQPRFLLSEALRGEGARLVNADGEPFMLRYDPAGDLAPRDRVSRGIAREAQRTGKPVYLTLAHLDPSFVHERFPLISAACRTAGLDLATDPIPVGPAAHYVMGGVVTDLDGRTTIPGLLAAGEVACTGVHGANRLASNSLLEGLVFGARAGDAMRRSAEQPIDDVTMRGFEEAVAGPVETEAQSPLAKRSSNLEVTKVRDLMWRQVGLFRDADGLRTALAELEPAWQMLRRRLDGESPARLAPGDWEAVSLLTVGRLIARAAWRREESRGGHFRLDFPERDDRHWQRRIIDIRAELVNW
jgi:L-aspartate oxidase